MQRASAYEREGDSPRDAWERAQPYNGIGSPFGGMMTPISGYGWSTGTSSCR